MVGIVDPKEAGDRVPAVAAAGTWRESRNLLAFARWENSAFHGFQDDRVVVKGLVDDMMAQVRPRPKTVP